MRVLTVRNVHDALPFALQILDEEGRTRSSRAGDVIMAPWPVTTVYQRPQERVIFWPQRDANPALHLYESLWMLAGRNDVEPLARYARRFMDFSDDGETLHDAYGFRWREHFQVDQLLMVADMLNTNPNERRAVLTMWDPDFDLGRKGAAVPCNLVATPQLSNGVLELTVFCRSNDIVWGAYGANAVHFSFLQEYLAVLLGAVPGPYRQVSVNWHAYLDVYETLRKLPRPDTWAAMTGPSNPYDDLRATPLEVPHRVNGDLPSRVEWLDQAITKLTQAADNDTLISYQTETVWQRVAAYVLHAHRLWRHNEAPNRFTQPLGLLETGISMYGRRDWLVAMHEWIERRYERWRRSEVDR